MTVLLQSYIQDAPSQVHLLYIFEIFRVLRTEFQKKFKNIYRQTVSAEILRRFFLFVFQSDRLRNGYRVETEVNRLAGDRKQQWKQSIQNIYLSGDDDKLYRLLRPIIHSKAKRYGRAWKWTELTVEDFHSEFWELTWSLVEQPYKRTGYLFYDTWQLAVSRRAVDLIRRATQTRQQQFEQEVVRVGDRIADMAVDGRDFETTVVNRLYVQSILNDRRLTDSDRQLLQALYQHSDRSLNSVAAMIGLHRETARRQLDSIRRRLTVGKDSGEA